MSKAGECLIIKDAVFEDDEEVLEEAFSDFLRDFNRLEEAAKKGDYHAIKELIDVRSFAIYYLVSEFAVNPDAYVSSFYFYKDGINDRIHAGPLWDYDFAFGNKKWIWTSNPDFYSPIGTMVQKSKKSTKNDTGKLMYCLMEIPEFRNEVEIIFREEMSGRKTEFLLRVFNEAAKIKNTAISDSELWSDDGESFLKELKYLLDWVSKRYDYFEEEYGEKEWNFNPGVI